MSAGSDRPVAVVVGVGPGLGEALARRFASAGWTIVLMSRTKSKLDALAEELDGHAVACDVMQPDSIRAAFAQVRQDVGPVHTLLWNVGSGIWGNLDEIGVDALDLAWRTNALGLFVAAQEVVGDMRAGGAGNILVTGATATRRGKPFTTAFAAGKAAQRSLCESFARQLGPEGIHVGLVIIDAGMRPPEDGEANPTVLNPTDAAETFLHLAQQARSAWTFELELRPHVESW